MTEIKTGLYRVSLEEIKARGRCTHREQFRFRCLVCGDEPNHRHQIDGSFNQTKGVGHCFACGARYVLDNSRKF